MSLTRRGGRARLRTEVLSKPTFLTLTYSASLSGEKNDHTVIFLDIAYFGKQIAIEKGKRLSSESLKRTVALRLIHLILQSHVLLCSEMF